MLLKYKAVKSKALVLTFDDGPGSRLTPLIMRILAENNAKATFFLLGRNIENREAIVSQLADQGHQICSHGYEHLHHWKVSPLRSLNDIKRGWQAIDSALAAQRSPYAFRPPNGKLNLVSWIYLLIRRVPIIYWTSDIGDTWAQDKRINERVTALAEESEGAVVLAHDFDRVNENVSKMVLESVELALAQAREKGMQILTVSQLLKANN